MRTMLVLSLSAPLALALVGCGGSADGSGGASADKSTNGTAATSEPSPNAAAAQAAQSQYAGNLAAVTAAVSSDANDSSDGGSSCAKKIAPSAPADLCTVLAKVQGKSHPWFFAGVRNELKIPFDVTTTNVDVVFDLQSLQAASFVRTTSKASLSTDILGSLSAGASASGSGYMGFAFGAESSLTAGWSGAFAASATSSASADASSFFGYDASANAFCNANKSICGASASGDVCLALNVDVSLPTLLLSAAIPGLPWDAVTAELAAHVQAQADASGSATLNGGSSGISGQAQGSASGTGSVDASAAVSFAPQASALTDPDGHSYIQYGDGASIAFSIADAVGSAGRHAWFAASVAIALDVQKSSGLSYAELCQGAGSDNDAGAPTSSSDSGTVTIR